MAIPVYYSFRNLMTRRLTTALTAMGMALVVFVFAATLMLAEGLEQSLAETGFYDNIVVIRKGAGTEVQSGVERGQAAVIQSLPYVATGRDGRQLFARELVVLINLPKRGNDKPSNVLIRGIGESSLRLRPQASLIAGRLPRPGSNEIMAGESAAKRFKGAGLGESLRFGMQEWIVVGVFGAGESGFNSEIWGDVDQLMQAFRRPVYSSLLFKLRDPSEFAKVKQEIESDPRLTVEAKRETQYYLDQSEVMATFLRIMGVTLTTIFSIGAVIGAMITMYSAVANRTSEIGTLRALGFSRWSILAAFLAEAGVLGLISGLLGVLMSSAMQLITISTVNWQTFSELAFSFRLTPGLVAWSMGFSLFMGLAGGALPAYRAAKMNIVESLRTS